MLIILIMGKSLGQMLHIDNSGNMLMTMDGLTIQKDASGNTQLNLDGLIISKDPSGGAIDYSLVKNKPVIREADLKVQVPVGTMMSYIGNDYIEDPTFVKPGLIVNRNDYIELANTIGIPKSQTTFTVPSMPTDWNSITNNPFTTSTGIGISTNITVTNVGINTGLVVNQKVIGDIVDFKYQDTSVFKITDGGNIGIGTNNPQSKLDINGSVSCNQVISPTVSTSQLIGNITVPSTSKLAGTDVGTFHAPYSVVQIRNITNMQSTHIATATDAYAYLGLTCSITPCFASSRIKVEFFSTMAYGAAGWFVVVLERSIGGGAYIDLTPGAFAASRYEYGWTYVASSWFPMNCVYYDTPNTTQSVTYRLRYRNANTTTTSYLVHRNMEYGWTLTEIKQP